MFHRGCFPPFTETWVFIGNPKVSYNVAAMEQFLHLTFATTTDEARRHFPRDNGAFSLGMLRHMFVDYVILGKLQSGEVWDISRTGMVKNVSEFKAFWFSQNNASLGALGGTPAARAAAKALAKASATAEFKITGAIRRRDAYVNAFSNVFKSAPRVAIPSDRVDR